MKLTITPQRLAANKTNGLLGAQARKQKQAALYAANPTHCTHCTIILPQAKKNNRFCSKSCAASHNNTLAPKRTALPRPLCAQCSQPTKTPNAKYCCVECSTAGSRKYSPEEAAIVRKNRTREVSGNYRAKLLAQTPPDADRAAMREFYANCPQGYEVDHIIPISRGGLHSLENLQYLTITENRRKSNKIV